MPVPEVGSRWKRNDAKAYVTVARVDGRKVYVRDANGVVRSRPLDHVWFDKSNTSAKYYRPA